MKVLLLLMLIFSIVVNAEEYHQYDRFGNKMSDKPSIIVDKEGRIRTKDRFGNIEYHKGYHKVNPRTGRAESYDKFGNREPRSTFK